MKRRKERKSLWGSAFQSVAAAMKIGIGGRGL
jgi:hypothetical protein